MSRNGDRLTAREVYEIWRIRDVVFSVEQQCTEPDVDGVDLRPDCTHVWIAGDDGAIRSYLRTYLDDGVRKVGRVATLREARGRGLSGVLLREAIDRWGDDELHLGAQAHLEDWYASFGFQVCGEPFIEAGIDHVPMCRPGRPSH